MVKELEKGTELGAWAVVPAAGKGERFGASMPKQFVPIAGVPLLHRTIRALWACPFVRGIALALPTEVLDFAWVLPAELRDESHVRVCAGGHSRTESVRAALALVPDECETVLVHDGARPVICNEMVQRVLQGVLESGACVPGLSPADTVKRVDDGHVEKTLVRDELRLVQTPQGFRKSILLDAYAWLDSQEETPFLTDDASLVEAAGVKVKVVDGDPDNRKVTLPKDIASLGLTPPRVGHGYDVHRLVAGLDLVLGGVHVPHDKGLLGHSDADVVLHALADAMLGAAALGDIGRMFPDTDPRWKGADSGNLLEIVRDTVEDAGWVLSSADLTIVAQEPRLASYLPAMGTRIEQLLELYPSSINVKATTEEGLGLTGSANAIAAYAVAMLVPAPMCKPEEKDH